ncbi:MAG: tyrosine-type recombinase/integrase [Thermodesulfobacteriota bacterium]|nr:tyrosine-type recombinase/integrase [Thermodesulfobacteriota bacterium]
MKLSSCIHQFFDKYLPHIKGASRHTIKAYRDTFTLFLPFAANYCSIKIESLMVNHLTPELILAFLDNLEQQRKNLAKTRNHRLAALKSLAGMIRFMYPEKRELADKILNIPQKRTQKQLIGFLYQEEILKVFQTIDLKKNQGFRDYTLLHLLYDSGARASEIATLNLDYLNPQQKTLAILGKGNRYRLVSLWPKTIQLLELYIAKYRVTPRPLYQHRMFINQSGREFTRHGIYRICKKYLSITLTPKRLKRINPVHSFRHSCAVNMLSSGFSLSDIKNHLGHEDMQSTTVYLHLDLTRRREIQNQFIKYTQSVLTHDPKIEELIDWENKEDIMAWLDSL